MWALKNKTPYAVGSTWIRDKNGEHHWVVVVKATFDVAVDGSVRLSDTQLPPLLLPVHQGEPANSSLRYDADLVAYKPTTDILLNGYAHAPKRMSAKKVTVKLQAGPVVKELLVHGSRVFYRGFMGPALSEPARFVERPILYEWAFGGFDTRAPNPQNHVMDRRNPIGKGFAASEQHLIEQPGWSIEYPKGEPAKMGPAGFGPIASHWSPRFELAGTYDRKWEETRKPLLPSDYDDQFVLCSPVDQRPPKHLKGGEQVELVNLTPQGVLRFALPKVRLSFTTYFGWRAEEHEGSLASVLIEPQELRVVLLWQSSLKVRPTVSDYLDGTLIQEKAFFS